MTRISLIIVAIFCIVQNAAATPYDQAKKEVITLVGEKRCPYNCDKYIRHEQDLQQMEAVDENHHDNVQGFGYIVDVARAIYKPLGHKVLYLPMDEKPARKGVISGRYLILLSDAKIKKRSKAFKFSKFSIGESSPNFYTSPDTGWRYSGLSSLDFVTLGLAENKEYPQLAEYIKANKNMKLRIQFNNDSDPLDSNLRKLTKNRLGAILEDKYTADFYRKSMRLEDAVINAGAVKKPKKLYLAFSAANKNSDEYIKQFDEGLARLRESGELQKILDKYGIQDWQNN